MPLETAPRPERRRYARRTGIANKVRLRWETPSGRVVSWARLIDVSEGGVLVSAEVLPPLSTFVSFRLEEPVRVESCLATVVRYDPVQRVALKFWRPPAYDLVVAATVGIDLLESLIDLPPDDRFSHADE